jgi:23S rRNA pseudouridine2605 synthase
MVLKPPVGEAALDALREGVRLDGRPAAPAQVKRVGADTLEITIHEGRKRQVKQMCERVGQPVAQLQRIRFGPLELGSLQPGEWRRLSAREIDALATAGSAARRCEASSSAARPTPRRG